MENNELIRTIAEIAGNMSVNPLEGSYLYKRYEEVIDGYAEKRRALDIINADMPDNYAFVMVPDVSGEGGRVLCVYYEDETGNRDVTLSNHKATDEIPEDVMKLLDKAGFNEDKPVGKLFHTMEKDVEAGKAKFVKTLNITIDNPDEIALRLRGDRKYKETSAFLGKDAEGDIKEAVEKASVEDGLNFLLTPREEIKGYIISGRYQKTR